MMDTNPYLAEWMMKDNVSGGHHWAEKERLVREARGSIKMHRWWSAALVAFSILLALAAAFLG
jgi:hypothetical protein